MDTDGLQPYGYDRYLLEQWAREHHPDSLIIRLPGLFGRNIEKDFIYDMIHLVPRVRGPDRFEELAGRSPELLKHYELQGNGLYQCRMPGPWEERRLQEVFRRLGFTALDLTDSRSRFQFYPLNRLWADIRTALRQGIRLWHAATEPVSAAEVYQKVYGREFVNLTDGKPADYGIKSIVHSV